LLQAKVKWTWGKPQKEAFMEAKSQLASSGVLVHFDPQQELTLMWCLPIWSGSCALSQDGRQLREAHHFYNSIIDHCWGYTSLEVKVCEDCSSLSASSSQRSSNQGLPVLHLGWSTLPQVSSECARPPSPTPVLSHHQVRWSPPSGLGGDAPTHAPLHAQLTSPSSPSRRHLGVPSVSSPVFVWSLQCRLGCSCRGYNIPHWIVYQEVMYPSLWSTLHLLPPSFPSQIPWPQWRLEPGGWHWRMLMTYEDVCVGSWDIPRCRGATWRRNRGKHWKSLGDSRMKWFYQRTRGMRPW